MTRLSKLKLGIPRMKEHPCFNLLVESIREEGIVNAIIIDEEFNVIDGYWRVKAAEKLNLKDVPTRTWRNK